MQNHCLVMQMKWELTEKHSGDHEPFAKTQSKDFYCQLKGTNVSKLSFVCVRCWEKGKQDRVNISCSLWDTQGIKFWGRDANSFLRNFWTDTWLYYKLRGKKTVFHPSLKHPNLYQIHPFSLSCARPEQTLEEQDFGKQTAKFTMFCFAIWTMFSLDGQAHCSFPRANSLSLHQSLGSNSRLGPRQAGS